MSFEQLQYAVASHVATITLNRPDRLNALTRVMEAEIRLAMEQADADPGVRAIILTGAGRGFCAGMDMDELAVLPPDDIRAQQWMRPYDMNRRADYQTRYSYFPAIGKPVIAAVNGAAAGLGLIMALYSDIRFASKTAVFSTAFAKRGLIAEHGIAWILPRVVGQAHAADLLFSSRKIAAEEALGIGLVNRVTEPEALLEETLAYARDLAGNVSPRSIRIMKRQLWEAPYQTLGQAIADANQEMFLSIQSADFKEGIEHFQQRRPAAFTGE
ncbi:MAG: enoyl-CoA hydratase [Pollutimonas bauzanensis]